MHLGHIMEDIGELAPSVQLLDLPVAQAVDQLVTALSHVDSFVPEQVIEVPKLSLPLCRPRTALREPQTAEQLVEVPTVLSYSSFLQRTVEQTVDIPAPRSGQSSSSSSHVSVEWVRLKDDISGMPYYWNRRTCSTVWKPPPGVEVMWYGERDEKGVRYYWHRDTRVSTYLFPFLRPG